MTSSSLDYKEIGVKSGKSPRGNTGGLFLLATAPKGNGEGVKRLLCLLL